MLNFIAIDLQLYKIFKITRVWFLGHCMCVNVLAELTTCRSRDNTSRMSTSEMIDDEETLSRVSDYYDRPLR